MRMILFSSFLMALFFTSFTSLAQQLSSDTDSSMTIKSVSILPGIDNLDSIYSKKFENELYDLVQKDYQWDYRSSQYVGKLLTTEQLTQRPQTVKQLADSSNADGLLLTELGRTAKGFSLTLSLFNSFDGELIAQATNNGISQTSMETAVEQLRQVYKDLKANLPYDALILSRDGQRVTINLGEKSSLSPGQTLSVSRIVNIKRHPKFKTIIDHKSTLIGTVKILKIDKAIAFADITTEIKEGVIQKDSKIHGVQRERYANKDWIKKDYLPTKMALSENNKTIMGDSSREWRPETPPTFGRVSAALGLGQYKYNLGLADGSSLNTENSLFPSVNLAAELWINPEWFVTVAVNQGTGDSGNPRGGELTAASGQYSMDFGYNLLLLDDFWNSKLYVSFGYLSYEMTVDQSTDGLTSTEYSSMRFMFGGKTPIDKGNRWVAGANIYWYFNPSLNEKPFNSGAEESRIVHFTLLLDYRWSERLWINGELDFRTFTSDFSGAGSRPTAGTQATQRFTTLNMGMSYMF